ADYVFYVNRPSPYGGYTDLERYWSFVSWTATGYTRFVSLPTTPWALSATPAVGLLLLGTGLLFAWRVGANDFSLVHFHKNRLVRCYLGASHTVERQADWFTGFDPTDDIRLAAFDHIPDKNDPAPSPLYPGPYPILNCALNLAGGEDLLWLERKT